MLQTKFNKTEGETMEECRGAGEGILFSKDLLYFSSNQALIRE